MNDEGTTAVVADRDVALPAVRAGAPIPVLEGDAPELVREGDAPDPVPEAMVLPIAAKLFAPPRPAPPAPPPSLAGRFGIATPR